MVNEFKFCIKETTHYKGMDSFDVYSIYDTEEDAINALNTLAESNKDKEDFEFENNELYFSESFKLQRTFYIGRVPYNL